MVVYHPKNESPPCVQTCVRIPEHLRAFARESGISLSGTLRAVLETEYLNAARATPGSNHPDRSSHALSDS